MSIALITKGMIAGFGTGSGPGETVYVAGGGIGGEGGGVERKKPVVLVSMVHERKKKDKIIEVTLLNEV